VAWLEPEIPRCLVVYRRRPVAFAAVTCMQHSIMCARAVCTTERARSRRSFCIAWVRTESTTKLTRGVFARMARGPGCAPRCSLHVWWRFPSPQLVFPWHKSSPLPGSLAMVESSMGDLGGIRATAGWLAREGWHALPPLLIPSPINPPILQPWFPSPFPLHCFHPVRYRRWWCGSV
jgi:hypothetical protein